MAFVKFLIMISDLLMIPFLYLDSSKSVHSFLMHFVQYFLRLIERCYYKCEHQLSAQRLAVDIPPLCLCIHSTHLSAHFLLSS
jgi:hypothetical protein